MNIYVYITYYITLFFLQLRASNLSEASGKKDSLVLMGCVNIHWLVQTECDLFLSELEVTF